ncbi:MAG: type II toxin-antitoxin system RelE/ParE family toxin [Bacteroidota bacterium]
MKVNVIVTPDFQRDAKKLLKKYPSLKSDLARLADDLLLNPKTGTQLSAHVYKIRLAIKSKGKGKSGGARVISYVDILTIEESDVYLLTIYDKSEFENISDKKLKNLIQRIEDNLSNL